MPESTLPEIASLNGKSSIHAGLPTAPSAANQEVLEIGPFHKEVLVDLCWAENQYFSGAFNAYMGQYVVVVNQTVLGVGKNTVQMIQEAAAKADVIPNRVVLFLVDSGEWSR